MVTTHDTTAMTDPDRIINAPPRRFPTVDPHIDRIYVLNMRTPGLRTDSWLSWFAEQEAGLTFQMGMDANDIETEMAGSDPSDLRDIH